MRGSNQTVMRQEGGERLRKVRVGWRRALPPKTFLEHGRPRAASGSTDPRGHCAKTANPAKLPANAGGLERITTLVEELLDRSGYVHDPVESSTRLKIRRLVRRLELTAHDAEIWMGMLRQIRWKLGMG
jgi:hypothetical protein